MKKISIKFKQRLSFLENSIVKARFYILGIFILGLIGDIFFNPKISDSIVILLIVFWLINIKNFKIKSTQTLVLAISAYFISFVFQFFGKEAIMEKGASWFFVFLLIGLVQAFIRSFSGNGKKSY